MLKDRILTALVMAAAGLGLLFLLPPVPFAIAAALLLLGAGGREAGRLAGLDGPVQWLVYAGALLIVAVLLYALLAPEQRVAALGVSAIVWLGLLAWLARPEFGRRQRVLKLFALGIVLIGAWLAVSLLQAQSPWLVLLVVVIIAAADIGAYFSGKAIGGPRLAPAISPGKTRAGAAGGLLAATAVTVTVVLALPDSPFSPGAAAAIGFCLAALSIGGDLFMSLLKRQQGLKDTSSLLPGHGGLLDRFDSLGAALPFFALAWLWWGQ